MRIASAPVVALAGCKPVYVFSTCVGSFIGLLLSANTPAAASATVDVGAFASSLRPLPSPFNELARASSADTNAAKNQTGASGAAMGGTTSKMIYRPLGKTGLRVSAIGYGAWLTFKHDGQVDVQKAKQIMKACVDSGINFFDNAESYGGFQGESEIIMGEALRQLVQEDKVVSREDLVISTKLFNVRGDGVNNKGLSRKHVLEGMRNSLVRLQLDYVDLVFAHRFDPTTPLEETVRAFNYLLDHGKALYWGTSEWTSEEIARAQGIADRLGLVGPVMEQPLYNLLNRKRVEKEYKAVINGPRGLGLTTYSPLAEGILAGRYLQGKVPKDSRGVYKDRLLNKKKDLDIAERLLPVAQRVGVSLPQLVLAWTLQNEDVSSMIMGASQPGQVFENVQAIALAENKSVFTAELKKEIEDIAQEFSPAADFAKTMVLDAFARGRGAYYGGEAELYA